VIAVHETGALAALIASIVLVASAGLATWLDVAHAWVRRLALAATALFGAVALAGVFLLASGQAPAEGLHLLYAVAVIGAVPLGLVFAGEAPPRARSGVLAVVGLATLLLAWRLLSTG
jgi:hypothetical protein